jgi:CDP-diacylglycerol--glycerol-3-phosphate 3-phosphatidyltransferase
VLPAQRLGKYKAFTQYCAVGFVLLPTTADWIGFQQTVLAVAVALTVVSGLQIVRRGYVDWQRQDS